MANESVGQIGLDLVVNEGSFNKQMAGLQNIAQKAGKTLAAAFGIKKLVDFSKQCIELGSDLQEVQNVVDVTFPNMSKRVNSFARNAVSSFGLSETMAKKFTGTFGAMSKAFGFGEAAAYEMSTTLTGLAGDVASFYNISQDEAYTKLKSVFTGETESLKDLGVVMTQTALDSYALANGFGKTTAKMSEMEKVALRYQFVQEQLSAASGDFIRTSDGWANQIRVLQLQFDSLKATIGQGLINVLTPVLKVINTIIGKLMSLANAFKAFTELISGKKSGGGASAAAAGMEALAASADKAGASAGGAGSAAKKAAKDMKGITTGIDELNIIQAPDESGSDGGSGGSGGYAVDEFDMGELDTSGVEEMENRYSGLLETWERLSNLFSTGFKIGFGDISVLDSIQTSLDNIKKSLNEIFTDSGVGQAASQFFDTFAQSLGQVSGSVASITATIADNLIGGVEQYLSQNSQRVKEYLVSMFDIGSEISEISGTFSIAVADIFTVFQSDSAKQITADLLQIFSDAFMGVNLLASSFALNIVDLIASPIINNADKIKIALEGILRAVQPVTSGIAETFQHFVDGLLSLYDKHIDPLFQSLRDGFSEIAETVLDAFNTHILPVVEEAGSRFSEFCANTLQPLIDKFFELAGKVTDCIRIIWEEALQPFIIWFVENIAPIIAENLQSVVDAFFSFLDAAASVIDGVLETLDGLIEFVIGVFTGDWKRAWEGIKQFFSGIWETMRALVDTVISAIYTLVETKILAVKSVWELIWNTIKDFFTQIWESIKTFVSTTIESIQTKISTVMETVKTGISEALTTIKTAWTGTWQSLKAKTKEIFEGIWSTIKGIINSIIGGIETMVNSVISGINKMIEAINEVADKVPGIDAEFIPKISKLSLPRLAQGGFVRANTPQLAMIGDNRHYGEIVAPEDKLQEMVDRAVAMASGSGMSDVYLEMMVELLKKIIELIEAMDLTVSIDIRDIKKKLVELDKRSGYTLKTT